VATVLSGMTGVIFAAIVLGRGAGHEHIAFLNILGLASLVACGGGVSAMGLVQRRERIVRGGWTLGGVACLALALLWLALAGRGLVTDGPADPRFWIWLGVPAWALLLAIACTVFAYTHRAVRDSLLAGVSSGSHTPPRRRG
jgi:hypothetical protein